MLFLSIAVCPAGAEHTPYTSKGQGLKRELQARNADEQKSDGAKDTFFLCCYHVINAHPYTKAKNKTVNDWSTNTIDS